MRWEIETITVSPPKETLRPGDERYAAFGFPNRSKFIDAAIRAHISRDIRQVSAHRGSKSGEILIKAVLQNRDRVDITLSGKRGDLC